MNFSKFFNSKISKILCLLIIVVFLGNILRNNYLVDHFAGCASEISDISHKIAHHHPNHFKNLNLSTILYKECKYHFKIKDGHNYKYFFGRNSSELNDNDKYNIPLKGMIKIPNTDIKYMFIGKSENDTITNKYIISVKSNLFRDENFKTLRSHVETLKKYITNYNNSGIYAPPLSGDPANAYKEIHSILNNNQTLSDNLPDTVHETLNNFIKTVLKVSCTTGYETKQDQILEFFNKYKMSICKFHEKSKHHHLPLPCKKSYNDICG